MSAYTAGQYDRATQRWRRRGGAPWLGLTVLALLYAASGLRLIPEGALAVRESPLLGYLAGLPPVKLEPGWCLAPPGLFRIAQYEARSLGRVLGEPEPLRLKTPEGSTVVASVEMDLAVAPQEVVRLHGACGGDLDAWLAERLRGELEAMLATPEFSPLSRAILPRVEASARLRLAEAGRNAGLEVASLRFRQLGYEGAPLIASGPQATARRKVLWLAVDSFDWDIARPLMEAGRMPHLKRLVEEGASGDLQPVAPLLSPVIWTSVATGKTPGKHGIVDFVASDPATGAVIPVTSTLRRSRAFWNILSDAGVSVGVIAWWASFPAEPVQGFMATDRIAYQLFRDRIRDVAGDDLLKTHPRDLFGDIAPLIVPPAQIADGEVGRFINLRRHGARFSPDDRERVNEFKTVLASARTYAGIGMKLFEARPTEVRVIYFEGPDTASHLFMPFAPPRSEGVAEEKVEMFGRVVPEFYAYQDEWIGRFIQRFADSDTTIVLCSDHGFKTGSDRPGTESRISKGRAADWHNREGMIVLAGKDVRRGGRILGATVMDLVPTLLALYGMPVGEDMDGKVLTAALTEEFLQRHPARSVATYETAESRSETRVARVSEGDQELLQKLQSLGYIQQSMPTASVNQGTIHLQAGQYPQAIKAFEAALEKLDQDRVRLSLARAYRLNGDLEKARLTLEGLLSKGFERAAVLSEMAAIQRDQKDWEGAERLLKEALEADPKSAEARLLFARMYEQRRLWPEAVAAYRKVLEVDPSAADAYNQIGFILRVQGKLPEAILNFEKAIEVNADLTGPYNNLGLLYRELGRTDRAREILETGVAMAPRSHILHNSLGSLLVDIGEVDRALASFEKALELAPNYAEAVYNLALIYEDQGRNERAGEYYRRLLELEPGNVEARLSLALALMKQRNEKGAVPLLQEVVEKDPQNFKGLAALGKIHLSRGRTQEAVALLERAGRVDDKVVRLWNDLGRGYLALGRPQDARDAFLRSLQIDPKQPEITRELSRLGG
jgi:tetratricopeptide (TPR) repeat protein